MENRSHTYGFLSHRTVELALLLGVLVTLTTVASGIEPTESSATRFRRLQLLVIELRADESLQKLVKARQRFANGVASEAEANSILNDAGMGTFDKKPVPEAEAYLAHLEAMLATGVDRLVDPTERSEARGLTVMRLARDTPHPAFLPLLRELARSDVEAEFVRVWAIKAISLIPHPDVIPELIQFLHDPALCAVASDQLSKLTGVRGSLEVSDASQTAETYSRWWGENRSKFVFDRMSVLREH